MTDTLKVTTRELRPRSVRTNLRKEGKVLGVVYGYKVESTPVAFEEMALRKILREHGDNALIELNIDGKKVNTLVHGTEVDPFTNTYKHVEFMAVKMDEATEVEADVTLVGDAKGVKEGGFLSQALYKVTVSATPANIPERIELDVSELGIGDSLTVADIPKNKDYEILSEGDLQIASVNEPVAVEEEETEGEEASAPEKSTKASTDETTESSEKE
ncbi:50S ribosomal protein L25/general stress protein Ctc [Exiguobacterium sp. SH3S2]|uniref:50S ribosomal protein L25/general stress protein Ctc n=1 Tax=unclassified Exiguobacterium TaxID=2644629 RepID=UPI001038DF56|nr:MULTISPECIES: 50S ribosomal protein L25/general stress protein Ctc [unclassified Exiguobacterium]TCI24987.1 50S ribosomal protein L25/general stress protein Ctc [Exiguobacterium sp. SH5S4]TCI45639.1 50S ribosomal protein L25/general stress protein Ctc [Exiguobacterium sp. SH3S3]TCI56652.1 50S ribosomal protein L25/general stress protein Ctc [Exiguobacterium sp. SH5S13]TCI60848.1 50S ribosomal protein L25/general stress protein Ctc [Exiguobacterium sp. SH3S2]TCI65974.1 50S ribosomal protein 